MFVAFKFCSVGASISLSDSLSVSPPPPRCRAWLACEFGVDLFSRALSLAVLVLAGRSMEKREDASEIDFRPRASEAIIYARTWLRALKLPDGNSYARVIYSLNAPPLGCCPVLEIFGQKHFLVEGILNKRTLSAVF